MTQGRRESLKGISLKKGRSVKRALVNENPARVESHQRAGVTTMRPEREPGGRVQTRGAGEHGGMGAACKSLVSQPSCGARRACGCAPSPSLLHVSRPASVVPAGPPRPPSSHAAGIML